RERAAGGRSGRFRWRLHMQMILSRLSRQARQASRQCFQFGRASAFKSTSDLVDQLQGQLAVERHCVSELKAAVGNLVTELKAARAELAERNMMIRLATTPCSATVH